MGRGVTRLAILAMSPMLFILFVLVSCSPDIMMDAQCSEFITSDNITAVDVSDVTDAQWEVATVIVNQSPVLDPWLAAVAITAALEGSGLAAPPSGTVVTIDPFTGATTDRAHDELADEFYAAARLQEDWREVHGDELAIAVTGGDPEKAKGKWARAATITATIKGIGADYLITQRIADPLCEHRAVQFWLDTGEAVVIVDGWVRPVAGAAITTRISSAMGWRVHPVSGEWKFHAGTDFPADCGTPLWAMADGIVTVVDKDAEGYGTYVQILHTNGWTTLYAHMFVNGIFVEAGDPVIAGQPIAEVGTSGTSTGCHLHLEMRDPDGNLFNAAELFGDSATVHQAEESPVGP